MKRGLQIFAASFAVALAIVFGARVSADALAVVIGVILGVLASVPTTFLLTWALLHRRFQAAGEAQPAATQQPPVVLINATDRPPVVSTPAALPGLSAPSPTRRWTMVGEVDTDD